MKYLAIGSAAMAGVCFVCSALGLLGLIPFPETPHLAQFILWGVAAFGPLRFLVYGRD